VQQAELKARIAQFDRWHYQFDFGNGVTTPIFEASHVNRHEQRSRYFWDRLLQITGGSLAGHRVLDLGCNAGFWSLKAAEADAEFVLGVDGRQTHVDQAHLVFEAKGVSHDRYRFDVGNIFNQRYDGKYDVVLCLGLIYHIAKPLELFEMMSGVGADIIVIDTEVSLSPDSVFEVRREPLDEPRNAIDFETVFIPSRRAVADLGAQFGYHTVPLALNITDDSGMDDYRDHHRLAFICGLTDAVRHLPAEKTPLVATSGTVGALRRAVEPVRARLSPRAWKPRV
jgi:tRNA (mo5U34)-methyltransferase